MKPFRNPGCGFYLWFCARSSLVFIAIWCLPLSVGTTRAEDPLAWPLLTREMRPWAYWWWMGSAVDRTNLSKELRRCHDAGLGGVHIIPIYGAKGYENKFINYLSPAWMDMLAYTVKEAERLDLGVDMTTGTGWCFGGPRVKDNEANATVVVKTFEAAAGKALHEKFNRTIQALVAFSPTGNCVDLSGNLQPDGQIDWTPTNGSWRIYAISQRPSGQKVKRAAPGGEGHMLNLFYPEAMRGYLDWFNEAFARYSGPHPRALYQDSYEYRSDWAPDLFSAFEKRRGYRLQTELPALFDGREDDHAARVKSDYRETLSDLMVEQSIPLWVNWAHQHGFLTRYQAHGSPGNWLDLYAAADIPETEMFHLDRNKLVSRFAASAADVTGKRFASSETGTWLGEHFTETLGDVKFLLDDMFLSGINHVFYHGMCYSPDEAGWPGWHFYASLEMNPRNSIWRDVPALNAYASRCQSILQAGRPDNDVLLYWPIYDLWHNSDGLVQPLTIHARNWFEDQPFGNTARRLSSRGYLFDYISDRQLAEARAEDGGIKTRGGSYRALVVPPTQHMPIETLRHLLDLAQSGATLIFEEHLPLDVPGWGGLEKRRRLFKDLLSAIPSLNRVEGNCASAPFGAGRVWLGDVEAALEGAAVPRESMFDHSGLMCVRRRVEGGTDYFIANRSAAAALEDWVPLSRPAASVAIMDPQTGKTGFAALRRNTNSQAEAFLQLQPGESVILRCSTSGNAVGPLWTYWERTGLPIELSGTWRVNFLEGGPELPDSFQTPRLASWTELGDTNAQRYAGTARYALDFDAPAMAPEHWLLDLGRVCQSARVRLNGSDCGTLIAPPFRVVLGRLKPRGNRLEVEVTNLSANRIRDLDRRGVKWKTFYDINFVGLDYKPFDASAWPLTDSGLLGPVTLAAVSPKAPGNGLKRRSEREISVRTE
jgi:alpha-L-rhamnosidase